MVHLQNVASVSSTFELPMWPMYSPITLTTVPLTTHV